MKVSTILIPFFLPKVNANTHTDTSMPLLSLEFWTSYYHKEKAAIENVKKNLNIYYYKGVWKQGHDNILVPLWLSQSYFLTGRRPPWYIIHNFFSSQDKNLWVQSRLISNSQTTYRSLLGKLTNRNSNRSPHHWDFWMANTTSEIDWKFFLSFRSILAKLRASRSQSARLAASLIDSKSSTWATPTILLICKETHFRVQQIIKSRRLLI